MALQAEDIDHLKTVVQEAVMSAQESMAQMIAKQFMEIRTDIQDIQESLRKLGTRQLQMEADLADVGRICESLKHRVQDLHLDMEAADRGPLVREFGLRLDYLEREVADIRQRLT